MNKFIAFILGGVAGSLITWKFVEKKYKKLADEEIKSVVDKYTEMSKDNIDKMKDIYEDKVVESGYSEPIIEMDTKIDSSYIISPEEFGEVDNKIVLCTYYKNDILVDSNNDIIEQPELLIGDALEHFGEYEDDCVHVRNDSLKTDYEILKCDKTFEENIEEE